MKENVFESSQSEQPRVSVSFGIRGISLVPNELTQLLGMQPSHSFAKGDEFASVSGTHERPWGVWQLRSETSVSALDIEDHARFILECLEPKRDLLMNYLTSNEFSVDVRIWYETENEVASFCVSSDVFRRLSALCNEFNFSLIMKNNRVSRA
jgi:hypothetical protein